MAISQGQHISKTTTSITYSLRTAVQNNWISTHGLVQVGYSTLPSADANTTRYRHVHNFCLPSREPSRALAQSSSSVSLQSGRLSISSTPFAVAFCSGSSLHARYIYVTVQSHDFVNLSARAHGSSLLAGGYTYMKVSLCITCTQKIDESDANGIVFERRYDENPDAFSLDSQFHCGTDDHRLASVLAEIPKT